MLVASGPACSDPGSTLSIIELEQPLGDRVVIDEHTGFVIPVIK